MNIELAATHEAGHAVMQWLVGLEVGELVMTVKDGSASEPSALCCRIPIPMLADLRKRLLVLLAGNAVTLQRWPGSWNDSGDWMDAISALKEYLKLESLGWIRIEGNSPLERLKNFNKPIKPEVENRKTDNAEANALLQDAIGRCREIVADPLFQEAVGKVANAFIAAPVGEDGVTRLQGRAVVEICERVVGDEFKATNPWAGWIS